MPLVAQLADQMVLELVCVLVEQSLHILAWRVRYGCPVLQGCEVVTVNISICPKIQRLLVAARSFGGLLRFAAQVAELAPRLGQVCVLLHRCLQRGQRLLGAPRPRQALPQAHADRGGTRATRHGVFVGAQRRRPLPQLHLRQPEIRPTVARGAVCGQGRLQQGFRFVEKLPMHLGHSQIQQHGRTPRCQRQGLGECLVGRFVLPALEQRNAPHESLPRLLQRFVHDRCPE
ncbi:hypothetical protein D3C72_1298600 [compost metagenome]